MGCSGWFNSCATGKDLSSAQLVVNLVGLDDETSLTYVGYIQDGELSGEIKEVLTEDVNAHNGANKLEAYQLAGMDLTDLRIQALSDARPIVSREQGFAETPLFGLNEHTPTREVADEAFHGTDLIERYLERAAQSANDQRGQEEEILKVDGLTPLETMTLDTYTLEAERANQALDQVRMVGSLPEFAEMMVKAINDHDQITYAQKELLVGDLTMGGADAGINSDASQNIGLPVKP